MSTVAIIGGGTGGTLVANRLSKLLPASDQIVVIDQDDDHIYQPGLLFVPFGKVNPTKLTRRRGLQLSTCVDYIRGEVQRVELSENVVYLHDHPKVSYDALVIASGSRLVLDETDGLLGEGWLRDAFTFYNLEGATALATRLSSFSSGRIVVNVIDLPIKCPVAPLEFCFLLDSHLKERGLRDKVQISYVTPLDGAFTKPVSASVLGEMLDDRGIELVTQFNTGTVDYTSRSLISFDGRRVPFDLAVVIPPHGGAAYVSESLGLGDELGFVPTDHHTLVAKAAPNVFVIGDATDLPASKAGSVAHFEGEILCSNVIHFLKQEPMAGAFDGHANCFIESGNNKAMLIDFNYETEPLTGNFPWAVGLPLLKESKLNHLGKLAFTWIYWHILLKGRDIPLVGSAMPRAGKRFQQTTQSRVSQKITKW